MVDGAYDAACDFVPSLCSSAYGLGKSLWAFGEHPIDSVHHLAGAGYEMIEHVVDYLKSVDKEKLHHYAEELVKLYDKFDQLSEHEKGELIGYTIGKYGVDIFAGSAAIKGVSAYRKLKEANRICNFQSMASSAASKEIVTSSALKKNLNRCKFFENSKIHWGRQNKHIPGTNNYDISKNKSIWTHPNTEVLLKKFSGTGVPKHGEVGKPGYKELVDFKEKVGVWKNLDGNSLSTTKGTIHYSSEGAHIVPAHPDAKVW
ncbi:MAG: polymorphic toxin type 50 domain-containing protein [Chlamydiota bacterium]